MKLFALIIFVFFVLVASDKVYGATIYVDPNCVNGSAYVPTTRACTGGSAQVRQTIGAGVTAMQSANPGDILMLRGGTGGNEIVYDHKDAINLSLIVNGTGEGNRTRVTNFPGERIRIRPSAITTIAVLVIANDSDRRYVTIGGDVPCGALLRNTCNFIIDGSLVNTMPGSIFNIGGQAEVDVSAGNTAIIVENLEVVGGYTSGGLTRDGNCITFSSNAGTIRDSNVHGCRNNANVGPSASVYGVYASGGLNNATITRNRFWDTGGYGVHLNPQDHPPRQNIIISSNEFFRNGMDSTQSVAAIVATFCGPCYAFNNLIYDNNTKGSVILGIQIGPVWTSGGVYNNTIVNSSGGGIVDSEDFVYKVEVRNNIVVDSGGGFGNIYNSGKLGTISNNLCFGAGGTTNCQFIQDPRFVDTATNNYRLAATSPAINVGVNLTSPSNINVDIVGVARPSPAGTNFDLGAFEAGGTVISPPTVTINQPAGCANTSSVCVTGSSSDSFTGTATGTGLIQGSVTWINNRGGSGVASGTTSWTANLPTGTLKSGINVISVTVTDSNGLTATANRIVTYTPTFPGGALVAAYGFDEGSGASAVDSSGNSNPALLSGSPSWAINQGKFGNAILFDGVGQSLRAADRSWLDLTQSFTLSAWVFPTVEIQDFASVITKGVAYRLYAFSNSTYCSNTGPVGFVQVNGGVVSPSVSYPTGYSVCDPNPTQPLQINQWTHLAITYDGSIGGSNQLKIYRNGVLGTTISPATGYIEPNTAELLIAASQFGEYFAGRLDEVRVYNQAILQVDVGKLNVSPGAVCGYSNDPTQAVLDRRDMTKVSIMGDMNCPVVPQVVTSPIIKIPATASGLKLSGQLKLSQ